MTPPTSHNRRTVIQRVYRYQRRLRLLRLFGGYCSFCGHDGSKRRLELAHRFPARRPVGPDGQPMRRSMDDLLRAVSSDPFAFMVLCHRCHHRADGPRWRGWDI